MTAAGREGRRERVRWRWREGGRKRRGERASKSIERYANEFAKCQGDSFIELILVLPRVRKTE